LKELYFVNLDEVREYGFPKNGLGFAFGNPNGCGSGWGVTGPCADDQVNRRVTPKRKARVHSIQWR
jgi:hypothetical protein